MNVDELQKVNALAKELLDHKIAANTEEATQKAKEMIHGKSDAAQKTITEAAQDHAVASTPAVETRDHGEDINKLQNNVAYMTSDMKNMVNEIQSLQQVIAALKQDIIELKRAQHHAPTAAPAPEPKAEPAQPAQQAEPAKPEQTEPAAEKPTEGRERTGGFTEDDVSIDKVFYFGQK